MSPLQKASGARITDSDASLELSRQEYLVGGCCRVCLGGIGSGRGDPGLRRLVGWLICLGESGFAVPLF
jgi:hypothetical protein